MQEYGKDYWQYSIMFVLGTVRMVTSCCVETPTSMHYNIFHGIDLSACSLTNQNRTEGVEQLKRMCTSLPHERVP